MRALGLRSVLVAASIASLVTSGCAASSVTSTARAPVPASASAAASSSARTGYSIHGTLEAVAATSATNAWAVGYAGGPLIVHWNGSTWSRVPAAVPGGTTLDAIGASSPDNAWALGGAYHRNGTWQGTVAAHWDGRAWRQVPVPAASSTALSSVSVTSPSNAWAVGADWTSAQGPASAHRPLALHWNGSAWQRVPLPALPIPAGGSAMLDAVSATSARDAWAVGDFLSSEGVLGTGFVLHWNGSAWSQVPSAPASATYSIAIVATAASYVWLAGTVAGLWNGRTWTTVRVPLVTNHLGNRGGDVDALAVSGHNVWLAGSYCTPAHCGTQTLPLLLYWTGDRWKFTPVPASDIGISGLAVTSPTNAWAVGSKEPQITIILHWNGSKWT
jgi:hypothetical protein